MNDVGKNKPSAKNCSEVCDLDYWIEAEKQAMRSTLKTFKTGAIIFSYKTGAIIGRGCSHHKLGSPRNTIHAEEHALRISYGMRNFGEDRFKKSDLGIVIVTLGRSLNYACSSRPCIGCVKQLYYAVDYVHYAERMNDGSWVINSEEPRYLMKRIDMSKITAKYARGARLPLSSDD